MWLASPNVPADIPLLVRSTLVQYFSSTEHIRCCDLFWFGTLALSLKYSSLGAMGAKGHVMPDRALGA